MAKSTIKSPNKIFWTEYWITKAKRSKEDYILDAVKQTNGKWKCEIKLPLIKKTVTSISSIKINAMLNASSKAAKLIDEYMAKHPELKIPNRFKGKPYHIIIDETGEHYSFRLDEKYKDKVKRQYEEVGQK